MIFFQQYFYQTALMTWYAIEKHVQYPIIQLRPRAGCLILPT